MIILKIFFLALCASMLIMWRMMVNSPLMDDDGNIVDEDGNILDEDGEIKVKKKEEFEDKE